MPLQNATNGTKQIVGIPINGSPTTNNQTLLFNQTNNQVNWGTITWGQITGTLSNQSDLNTRFTNIDTAISGKQNTIALGTTSQYFRGDLSLSDFATDVRNILLTGLTINNNSAIVSTDTLLAALNKLQSQINNLPTGSGTTTTTLTVGGDNVTSDRSIGNNTFHSFSIETNNIPFFEFNKKGFLNIWANNRIGATTFNDSIPAGSLVLSDRTRDFGWNTNGWSNTSLCQQLFEFNRKTEVMGEISGIGLVSFWAFRYNNTSPTKEFVIGRNPGSAGRQDLIRLCAKTVFHGFEDVEVLTSNYYQDTDDKRNFIIQGKYPALWLVSRDSGNLTHSNSLKFAFHTGTNTARHFHIGQLNEGRRFGFGYYEGNDWNTFNGLNNNGRVGLMFTTNNNSPNNSLGDSFGMCLNVHDYNNYPYFNLHILGSTTNNGTIGWGLNNGISRTDILIDANASANYLDRQSGFFTPANNYAGGTATPSNYFPGSDGDSLLIQCRHPNGNNGLQIGSRHDSTNRFFVRTVANNWREILLHNGNSLSSTLKIGTLDNQHLQFIRNNINVMEFISNNQIIFQNDVIFGTTSIPKILEFNSTNRQILVNNEDGFGSAARPSYSWKGYIDRGMYIESDKVSFSIAANRRLAIDSTISRIESYGFPFKSDLGYYVGTDQVINSKHPTVINNLAAGASLTDVINLLNTLIPILKSHHKLFS